MAHCLAGCSDTRTVLGCRPSCGSMCSLGFLQRLIVVRQRRLGTIDIGRKALLLVAQVLRVDAGRMGGLLGVIELPAQCVHRAAGA
ncbi:hypothetical protein D9M69_389980 [compost metagenome]